MTIASICLLQLPVTPDGGFWPAGGSLHFSLENMSRIFFLEATVSQLQLEERTIRDADGYTNFFVKIHLLNLPNLAIPWEGSVENSCCEENQDYLAGRACHFIAQRRQIVKSLKSKPFEIGIYKETERFPRCHGIVPFSGCVCDLVTKSLETTSSFQFGGTFNLVDPGGNFAGTSILNILLKDLGRHVITSYALNRDSFLLKNEPKGCEYKCGRIKASDWSPARDDSAALATEKLMLDVGGIFLCAGRLSQGKPEAKGARETLEEPEERTDDESKVRQGRQKKSKKGSGKKTKGR